MGRGAGTQPFPAGLQLPLAAPPPELDDPPETPRTSTSERSAEPSSADVESASVTDIETQSSSVDPLEDREMAAAVAEQVKSQRWQCDLCFESHGYYETPWSLGDERCSHSLCRRCILGSIRWGCRCPYDNVPIPAIVVCGAMGTSDYIYHEKMAEVARVGGVPCINADCPGVAPVADLQIPSPVRCRTCTTQLCGRRVCGAPWRANHRCWDILEAERRREEQDLEARARHLGFDHQSRTRRRLASGPRFRPCPGCSAMVEHDGGCNMVYHDSCRTHWCFICRRIGSCSDFDCRLPSTPATPRSGVTNVHSIQPVAAPSRMMLHSKLVVSRFVALIILAVLVYASIGVHIGLPRSRFLGAPFGQSDMCGHASQGDGTCLTRPPG